MKQRYIIVMTVLFVIISATLFVTWKIMPAYSFAVLESGALLVYILSILSFMVVLRQLKKSPMAFTQGVTGASFLRLMVYMVAMLIYIVLNRTTLHKPSIFVFFGIYAVFTTAETILLSKMAKAVS